MKGLSETFCGFSHFGLGLLVVALVGGCGTEPPVPAAITISPENITVTDPGTLTRLVATVKDEDGRVLEGAEVDWSSSDSSVVTVSSDEPVGLVKVVGNGSASVVGFGGPGEGDCARDGRCGRSRGVATLLQSAGGRRLDEERQLGNGRAARHVVRSDDRRRWQGHRAEDGGQRTHRNDSRHDRHAGTA